MIKILIISNLTKFFYQILLLISLLNNIMFTAHNILVALTIVLYLLGRLCDDLGWYSWKGISTDGLESIALGALTVSATLSIIRRIREDDE